MAARIEHNALRFEHQALSVRLGKDHAAARYTAARIDNPMPRDVALIVWGRVHRPADEPRTVALFKQACDLAVGHHAAAGDAQHQPIDLFKDLVE
jgi:hypothetical protein